jgi:hypothetical protein
MSSDITRVYESASVRFHDEGLVSDQCLGRAGEESRYFNVRFARAIDMRLIAALPGFNISNDVKFADEQLLSSFRSFNHDVGINDIRRILDSTVGECLRHAKAGLAAPVQQNVIRFGALASSNVSSTAPNTKDAGIQPLPVVPG